MTTHDLRYQSGVATGFQPRMGRTAHGRELRYIPGRGSSFEAGDCYPRIWRYVFADSIIDDVVTGLEDTDWSYIQDGYVRLEGSDLAPLSTFGAAYGMKGVRFVADDRVRDDYYQYVFPGSSNGAYLNNAMYFNFSPHEIPSLNLDRVNYTQSTVLNALRGGPLPSQSHIKPEAVDSIRVPMPFAFGSIGGLYPANHSFLGYRNWYQFYVTHARPVVNDEVAGPLTELGGTYPVTRTESGTDYTFTVHGTPAVDWDRECMAPNVFDLPLFSGVTIGYGDVVGFDMWLWIARDRAWPIGTSSHPHDEIPAIINTPQHSRYAHDYYDLDHNYMAAYDMPIRTDLDLLSYQPGNAATEFNYTTHTYKLDFGSNEEWTPLDSQYFTFGDQDGFTFKSDDCHLVNRYVAETTYGAYYKVGLNWDGETCCLMFQFEPAAYVPNNEANVFGRLAMAIDTDAIEVGYYPRASTDEDWDDSYVDARPYGVTTSPPGPFNAGGSTVFDLAYVKYNVYAPYNPNVIVGIRYSVGNYYPAQSLTSNNNYEGPLLNMATSITVTRVKQ